MAPSRMCECQAEMPTNKAQRALIFAIPDPKSTEKVIEEKKFHLRAAKQVYESGGFSSTFRFSCFRRLSIFSCRRVIELRLCDHIKTRFFCYSKLKLPFTFYDINSKKYS